MFGLTKVFQNNINDILCDINFTIKNNISYSNVASVFDIEATSFYNKDSKAATMYAFVLGINGKCILGRTWNEFLYYINIIIRKYKISLKNRFVIYIHNLSYEFQWLKNKFKWHKVFAIEQRKPIYAITEDGIEFRCSYMLSGYSLAKVGENLTKYKINKLSGDLDYEKIRHSNTPLTDKEKGYILNDGLVVMAYIQEEIEIYGSVSNIPLTKTGKVRNLCREVCFKDEYRFEYNKLISKLQLSEEVYKLSKRVFTGGFTHANHNYVDKIIYNVHSYDFTSSYPAVMLSEKFPMNKGKKVIIKNAKQFDYYIQNYCCMFDILFYDIEPSVFFEHYISKSKCHIIEDYILDNGRVVYAKKLQISINEQDFMIIKKMYNWSKFKVANFYIFEKDYLPKPIIKIILDLYKDKTVLKNVEGKEVEYLAAKGNINSLYGMSVTDPCQSEIVYDSEWSQLEDNLKLQLYKYNKNTNRFNFYLWGIWVTAYAKRNLFTGILEFKSDYVYSDTDSIKVINIENHQEYINNYNRIIQTKLTRCLEHYNLDFSLLKPKTKYGETKLLGVWDYEGCYSRFKTLGAKRYITEKNNKLSITISGVNKITGIKYLEYTYKTNDKILKNFSDKLVFPGEYFINEIKYNASGKLCHTYIDIEINCELIDYLGNKLQIYEDSAVHMEPTSYNLSLDKLFLDYIYGKVSNIL